MASTCGALGSCTVRGAGALGAPCVRTEVDPQPAHVSIRIRQHTSAYVSIRQHAFEERSILNLRAREGVQNQLLAYAALS